jgi:hypothetical protein
MLFREMMWLSGSTIRLDWLRSNLLWIIQSVSYCSFYSYRLNLRPLMTWLLMIYEPERHNLLLMWLFRWFSWKYSNKYRLSYQVIYNFFDFYDTWFIFILISVQYWFYTLNLIFNKAKKRCFIFPDQTFLQPELQLSSAFYDAQINMQ